MDVRTFEAFSMKDAVKAVKKALGADAVILSTREKPAPTGRGTVYEVTAAASHGDRKAGASSSLYAGPRGAGTSEDQAQLPLIEAIGARVTALADQMPSRNQVQALESGMQDLKLLLLETLRTKDGSALQNLPAALVPLDRQLRVMGLGDICLAELMRHLRQLPVPEREIDAYYRDQAIRWLMKRIKIAPRWTLMPGAVSYQIVVGPTGVGKSALVAKLAALYGIREKHKVAVVSLDNHRLAAGEQMRIFCKIIGVPFVAAAAPKDILGVPDTYRDAELILVDTAGVSPKDLGRIAELETLKEAGAPIDIHLALSVTDKEAHLDQAVRAFSRLGLASLAFTKLDESWSFGEIYNVSRKWALPLSFFSIGQQIPDDIERASRERVIERLFSL